MAFRDRLRKVVSLRSQNNSTSSSSTTSGNTIPYSSQPATKPSPSTPAPPPETTTTSKSDLPTVKSAISSRLNLTRFRSSRSKDADTDTSSRLKYPGRVNTKHAAALHAWEFKFGRKRRSQRFSSDASEFSGISPGATRQNSVNSEQLERVLEGPQQQMVQI